ncbi:hypothetical protein B0T10DRAFT_495420 [Thelonectria olida]|uniref:Uncharacterized protein n=1 Tax=Thelonectria olida TaxID=1576542 RepID=A0A9P9AK80_9HYPO|nr:hypothetical protein B0T10DRAFT_495420 [Thelonectria olida]
MPMRCIYLAVWIVLAVLQAQYVPLLGHKTIKDCSWKWANNKKCKSVNGTWVCATVFIFLHCISIALFLVISYRINRLEKPPSNGSKKVSGFWGAWARWKAGSWFKGSYAPVTEPDSVANELMGTSARNSR